MIENIAQVIDFLKAYLTKQNYSKGSMYQLGLPLFYKKYLVHVFNSSGLSFFMKNIDIASSHCLCF